MFEEQEEGKELEKNKYDHGELDLEILRLNQSHSLDPGLGENPPSPNKKLRRWLSRKKKQKLDLQNIDNDSGSNRSDEPVSITEGVADSSLDDQSASKEDGDKQIWPLFKANSIFVFNSKKEDVKGLGPKMERKKSKSVAGTTKNRKKRVEISNNSITNYFTTNSCRGDARYCFLPSILYQSTLHTVPATV